MKIAVVMPVVCLAAGSLWFSMTKANAFAAVPFTYACDRASGFVMDPNAHKRIGYVTSLDGFGLKGPAAADLQVSLPFTKTNVSYSPVSTALQPGKANGPATARVVGVIEKISWNGGVGDAIQIDMYVSQQNALQIKAAQQAVQKTTAVKSLGWWVGDYDQETKIWYEQFYPKSAPAISGIISGKDNPELTVDLASVQAKDGIDVNVYRVSIHVVPAANQTYSLHTANASGKPVVKPWGLVVGSLANQAIPK